MTGGLPAAPYCWKCGKAGCSAEHQDGDRRVADTHCQRCGTFGPTYNCQDCDQLVCWDCGLKGGNGYEPDTGFYVCGMCA